MNDDEVRRYVEAVAREPLLTQDEEREKAKLAQHGDKTARKRLVAANLRLVASIAERHAKEGIPLGELLDAGMPAC